VHLFTNYNYCLQMILVSITYCGYTVAVVVSIAGSVTPEQESMVELTSICFLYLLILKYICVLLLGSAMNKGLQLLTIFESTRCHFIIHDSTCHLSPTPEIYFNPMNLSQGGENTLKKVSLAGPVLHPFLAYVFTVLSICLFYQQKMEKLNWLLCNLCACRRSYTDVLESFFEDKLLLSQQLFASEERCQKILDLIPDESKKRRHMIWTLLSDID
jgi:hypothetical protein